MKRVKLSEKSIKSPYNARGVSIAANPDVLHYDNSNFTDRQPVRLVDLFVTGFLQEIPRDRERAKNQHHQDDAGHPQRCNLCLIHWLIAPHLFFSAQMR